MKKSAELRKELTAKLKEFQGLAEGAAKEPLTEQQTARFNELETEIEDLQDRITQVEAAEKAELKLAAMAAGGEKAAEEFGKEQIKDMKRLNLMSLIRSQMPGGTLEGVEKEMHEEGAKELIRSNATVTGVCIPEAMFKAARQERKKMNTQTRADLVAGTDAAGGYTVPTDTLQLIEALRPELQVEALGAQRLTDLQGNVDIPKHSGVVSATWEGETDANAQSDPTFGQIQMTPNRIGAFTTFSKRLLQQSSIDVQALVASDLGMANMIAIDAAAINGSGSGNQPTGILNTSGIGDVAGGTNGLAPTWAHIVDLESEIAVDNALMGNIAYLTTPGIRGKLKQTEKASSTGMFVWDGADLNGYAAAVSTQVPSDLDKGTSTGVCHAIILGNWSELVIGYWGGIDLVVNPYSLDTSNQVRVTANQHVDVALRHAESFAAMLDALTS